MPLKNQQLFSNSYTELSNQLFSKILPNDFNRSELVLLNEELATQLEIEVDFLRSELGVKLLSGQTNQFGPLFAQAYAGHQYGSFTILGDGRATLLGERVICDKRFDIQLKGSGQTPYSRRGDGKATLYSVLREYLIGEAMHALRIPTTRALAVIKTNEYVLRETPQSGGVLSRVASSHIRVGTFQYVRTLNDKTIMREFLDYTIERHYPELKHLNNKYLKFFKAVVKNQAELIAKWQSVGFIHGVMNTDNMTISGETIDYGPCAFMNEYDPETVFSSIDLYGRYAYHAQPYIGSWNLARLAETFMDFFDDDMEVAAKKANDVLAYYADHYLDSYYELMTKKIGILNYTDDDKELVDQLLKIMHKYKADFTNTFRLLTLDQFDQLPFYETTEWKEWFQFWTRALGYRQMSIVERRKLMEQVNPVIIPRNLVVEEALKNASENDDYSLFNDLLFRLKEPYNYYIKHSSKFTEPANSDLPYVTYCGT